MRTCLLAAALWASAAAAENPWLIKAARAYDELKFAEAAKALDQAARVPDNDRGAVLRILELTGIVQATLKNQARAEEAFRQLFALNPEFRFEKELAPRVMTPYYQAKSWAADHGAVSLAPLPPRVDGEKITRLNVKVSDPVKLGRKVLFHVRQPGLAWSIQRADVTGERCSVSANATDLEWWAELVGERGAKLFVLGFADTPFAEHAAAPPPPPRQTVTEPGPTSQPIVVARPAASSSSRASLKLPAYIVAGTGALSAVVGAIFGVRAQSARSALAQATYDGEGRVVSPTQVQALQLESQLKSSALTADVLFGVAGVLIATGVILWLLGASG